MTSNSGAMATTEMQTVPMLEMSIQEVTVSAVQDGGETVNSDSDDIPQSSSTLTVHLSNIGHGITVESEPVEMQFPPNSLIMQQDDPSVFCLQLFWIRILILVLSVFLLCLSVVYTFAQVVDTKLAILKMCPERKTPEEIWEHSYWNSFVNGEFVLNEESHFGFTDGACWTTRSIEINTDFIWYTNLYDWEWTQGVNEKCILFGLLSMCWIVVIFYGVITLIMDLIFISRGTFHTKSRLFESYIQSLEKQGKATPIEDEHKPSQNGCVKRFIKWYLRMYSNYFGVDTAGFVFMKFASETMEFVIQSVALLKYNGYFNDLAVKPNAVITFASIIAFNMFGSGILWSLYVMLPTQCHGLLFKRSLFFVDKLSDLMYTLFPIYVILTDDYNSITNLMVLLGQLSLDGWYFVTAFVPSFFLCTNCLVMTITSRIRMENEHFRRWKLILSNDQDKTANEDGASSLRGIIHQQNNIASRGCKRIIVLFIASIFFLFGVFIITATVNHVNTTKEHCHSVTETSFISNGSMTYPSELQQQTLATNPELFAYNQCLYKVYPFTDDEIYRCQCRVFFIRWESDFQSTSIEREEYLNLTQPVMMEGMMRHWFMMEKLMTSEIDERVQYNLSWNAMRHIVHIKAIEWGRVPTTNLLPDHFDHWKDLEFLSILDTHSFTQLPESFSRLEKLRYLEMDSSGIDNHFPVICNLTNLEVIWFYVEMHIYELPECMNRLINMRLIAIEISGFVDSFPLSLLSLPQLSGFSLSRNDISWDSLLNGNMPSNVDRNDPDAVMEWLDEHFIFSNDTEYFLSLNPICYENVSFLSPRITEFITTACDYPADLSQIDTLNTFCGRYKLGDGKCHSQCNDESLLFDMGDCMQLCFAEEISNCTLDKLANDRCDPGCDNRYCIAYDARTIIVQDMEMDEDTMLIIQDNNGTIYAPDRFQCPWNGTVSESEQYPLCSASSTESMFIDSNIPNASSIECDPSWIGDTVCDDSCRVSDCGFDEGDCYTKCTDEICSILDSVWVYFTADQHILNFTYGCDMMYPTVLTFFNLLDVINCSEEIRSLDYNQDGTMNFREFVVFGVMAINDFDPESRAKASNVNCSSCGDSEYYNVFVGY